MECGEGSLCCGASFNFDFTGIDPNDVRFDVIENTQTIILTFVKDGSLQTAISFDCGQTFERKMVTEINKEAIKDIRVLAIEDQFVIALIETVGGQDYKRAFSGKINAEEKTYSFKECPRYEARRKGVVLSIAVGFRKYKPNPEESNPEESNPEESNPDKCETADYLCIIDGDTVSIECFGHH